MTGPTSDRSNDQPRGGDGRWTRSVETAERDAEACRLRSRGLSYRKIAAELGTDVATAHEAVQRALRAVVQEAAEDVRAIELDRLDRMHREVMAVLERQHVTVSNGKVVSRIVGWQEPNADGERKPIWEEVLDDAPVLAAVDRLLKIQERRAKLLGLDAPAKQQTDAVVRFSVEGVDLAKLT